MVTTVSCHQLPCESVGNVTTTTNRTIGLEDSCSDKTGYQIKDLYGALIAAVSSKQKQHDTPTKKKAARYCGGCVFLWSPVVHIRCRDQIAFALTRVLYTRSIEF